MTEIPGFIPKVDKQQVKWWEKHPSKMTLHYRQDAELIQRDKEKQKQGIHSETFERIKKEHALIDLEKTHELYSSAKKSTSPTFLETMWTTYEQYMWYIATLWEVNVSKKDVLTSFHNINELNKTQLNEYQETLVKKILWNDKWFNGEYLQWYNNEKWNYLIKISDFEKKYKNTTDIQELNHLELWSYINYLFNKKNNKNALRIINTIRIKLWTKTTIFNDYKDIKKIIFYEFDDIKRIFNDFINNLFKFKNINDFTNNFSSSSKEEQVKIIEHLKNLNEEHKQDFINSIKTSLPEKYNEKEREKIAIDFVNKILSIDDINKIIPEIQQFSSKYKISSTKIIKTTWKLQQENYKIKAAEAIQSWNKKLAEKIIKEAQNNQKDFKKVSILKKNEFNTLSTRLQNWESFDNVMQDLAQNNSELNKVLEEEKKLKKSNPGVESEEEKDHDEDKEKNNPYYVDNDEYVW